MRIYLTGADGMLGTALTKAFAAEPGMAGHAVHGVSIRDFDIADRAAVDASVDAFGPDVVVHTAALAIVDDCEVDPGRAIRVNVGGTHHVARAARRHGARFVYLSSDYVFDGANPPEHGYREDDVPNPVSVYGMTKLVGERIAATVPAHLIIRTSWLFGGADEKTDNVLSTIRRATRGEPARLIDDQYGCPTYTEDLARAITFLVRDGIAGTVHVVNAGAATWHQVGEVALAGFDADLAGRAALDPVALADCAFLGARPRNSMLSGERLARLGFRMSHWSDAVGRYTSALAEWHHTDALPEAA